MKNFILLSAAVAVSVSAVAVNKSDVLAKAPSASVASSVVLNKKADSSIEKVPVMSKSELNPNVKLNHKLNSVVNPLADVVAGYVPPTMFYWGFSEDSYWQSADGETGLTVYLGPAYVDQTWTNTSSGATQYSWSYTDPNATSVNDPKLVSTETNLTVNYIIGQYDVPVLTASDGANSDTYSDGYFMQLGASSYLFSQMVGSQNPIDYGAAMFNYGASYYTSTYLDMMMDEEQMLGNGLRENLESNGLTNVACENFGVIYPRPAAPYSISRMWLRTYAPNMPAGTEITADIYALGEEEDAYIIPAEPVAHAIFEATSNMSSTREYVTLTFNVVYEDPETGLEVEGLPLDVDSPLLITFPVNTEGCEWYPIMTMLPYDLASSVPTYNVYGFSFDYENESGETSREVSYQSFPWILTTQDNSRYIAESYELMTDATFGWFFPADGAPVSETNAVAVPTEGGSVSVPFESLWIADYTTVEEDVNGDGTLSDWATYTFGENESSGYIELTVTADPLPAGETGRFCICTLNPTSSAPVELIITQGAAGVSAVVAESAAKVAVDGGNFVVTAPETINNVTVYNVAGQAVAASEIAGTTTIDASSLAKGVYILRFNDGTSVKVIK